LDSTLENIIFAATMRKLVETGSGPVVLSFQIGAKMALDTVVLVSDTSMPSTDYARLATIVDGPRALSFNLPINPGKVYVSIYGAENGPQDPGSEYLVSGFKVAPLKQNLIALNAREMKFMRMACYVSRYMVALSTPHALMNDDPGPTRYRVDIVNKIVATDPATGRKFVSKTPCRVNAVSKRVEVARDAFLGYSVAGRVALLCHEYSHVYGNHDPANEAEADLRGLMLYACWGFPEYDAKNVFLKVFQSVPSDENVARWEHMKRNLSAYSNMAGVGAGKIMNWA